MRAGHLQAATASLRPVDTTTLAVNWLSAQSLIDTFSTAGVIAIVFAETGLLIGFFLPGDSLLFTAGLLAASTNKSTVHLNIAVLMVGCAVAAVVGAETGYLIGRKAGPTLFRKP